METAKLPHENRLLQVVVDNISTLRLVIYIVLGVALIAKHYNATLFGVLAAAMVILCVCQIIGLRRRSLAMSAAIRKSGYTIFCAAVVVVMWVIELLG